MLHYFLSTKKPLEKSIYAGNLPKSLLVLNKFAKLTSYGKSRLGRFIRWMYTFIVVNLLWILFRAHSLTDALKFYHALFRFKSWRPDWSLLSSICPSFTKPVIHFCPQASIPLALLFILCCLLFSVVGKSTQERMKTFRPSLGNCLATAVLLSYCILSFAGISSFLYWNF